MLTETRKEFKKLTKIKLNNWVLKIQDLKKTSFQNSFSKGIWK